MNSRNFLPIIFNSIIKSKFYYPLGRADGNGLYAYCRIFFNGNSAQLFEIVYNILSSFEPLAEFYADFTILLDALMEMGFMPTAESFLMAIPLSSSRLFIIS